MNVARLGLDRRAGRAAIVLVGWLAATDVARSLVVPSGAHLGWNLAIGAGAIAIAARAGLTRAELGLARDALGPGLRLGALAFAAITIVVLGSRLIPAADGFWADDRTAISLGSMLLKALVVIPIGTVLVEELAFRGALHGLLHRALAPWPARLVGAALFGLWHLPPTLIAALRDGEPALGISIGTVAATTVAGLGFGWLRERSGSVVAPMLAHLATNSVVLAVAWSANR